MTNAPPDCSRKTTSRQSHSTLPPQTPVLISCFLLRTLLAYVQKFGFLSRCALAPRYLYNLSSFIMVVMFLARCCSVDGNFRYPVDWIAITNLNQRDEMLLSLFWLSIACRISPGTQYLTATVFHPPINLTFKSRQNIRAPFLPHSHSSGTSSTVHT